MEGHFEDQHELDFIVRDTHRCSDNDSGRNRGNASRVTIGGRLPTLSARNNDCQGCGCGNCVPCQDSEFTQGKDVEAQAEAVAMRSEMVPLDVEDSADKEATTAVVHTTEVRTMAVEDQGLAELAAAWQ